MWDLVLQVNVDFSALLAQSDGNDDAVNTVHVSDELQWQLRTYGSDNGMDGKGWQRDRWMDG